MKKRGIQSVVLASMMLLGASAVKADNNNNKSENEYQELIELLDQYSAEAYREANGLKNESRVMVYDLDGSLILSKDESELNAENYKVLFQSDLMMESSGDLLYILNKDEKTELATK